MKITYTIIALLAAGFLGQSAFGSDNSGPLCLAVSQDGHGGSHFQYRQTTDQPNASVALSTSSGGVDSSMGPQEALLANSGGAVRFVIGTNQHAQPNAAYIQTASHFAPAGQ